jgi:hypothetical protein
MLEALFACAEKCTPESSAWMALALRLASEYDLSPMDALHAACALMAGVDEFVTLEKPGKPFAYWVSDAVRPRKCTAASMIERKSYRRRGNGHVRFTHP